MGNSKSYGPLRQIAAITLGLVLWYAIAIAADYLLVRAFGSDPNGARYALLGIAQLALGGAAVAVALRLGGWSLRSAGLTRRHLARDLSIGFAVAVAFAALQFLVVIPATGGAGRSDVAANAAQIGDTIPQLAGVLALAVFGSTSEELLFRGLLLGGIAAAAGGGLGAKSIATLVTTTLFALGHGYQGWAGMVDTGVYGGLGLSLLYWARSARLAAPIAAHVGWNAIAATTIFVAY